MYVSQHLAELRRRNLRPGTIYQRQRTLARLARYLEPAVIIGATPDDLRAYLDRLDRPESRATELSHLRGYYRWALEEDILRNDPTLRIRRPRTGRRLPRPMPTELLASALESAPDPISSWLYLAAYAGLRACEIAQLNVSDILFDAQPAVIVIEEQKGGDEGVVPMHPLLLEVLSEVLPAGGWIAPRRDGLPGPMRPWSVSGHTNRFLHELGIDHTLHSLRHWYVTEVYRASGGRLRETQELARHKSPVTTAGYSWVDPRDGVAIVGRLPEVGVSTNAA